MDVNEEEAAPLSERQVMGFFRSGLAYLDRYGGPRARIVRTLERRARRKELSPAQAAEAVARAMEKLDALGVIDDRAFARGKAQALRRRGQSRRAALAKLTATGIDRSLATETLDALDAEAGVDDFDAANAAEAAERRAAERYAERRRFGPWRFDPEDRAARRDRDVAAMTRAGFGLRLAMAVIDRQADDDEAF